MFKFNKYNKNNLKINYNKSNSCNYSKYHYLTYYDDDYYNYYYYKALNDLYFNYYSILKVFTNANNYYFNKQHYLYNNHDYNIDYKLLYILYLPDEILNIIFKYVYNNSLNIDSCTN